MPAPRPSLGFRKVTVEQLTTAKAKGDKAA